MTFSNVVFPTLAVLLFWACIALVLAGCGFLVRSLLLRLARAATAGGLIVADLWIGLAGVTAYVLLWNLWLPVDWEACVIPVAAGVIGLAAGGRRLTPPERRPSAVVLGVWGIAVLWLANASLGPAGDYDYGLYHLNLIDYARKYAALPGLADLHIRLGAGDAHLLFVALIDHGPLSGAAPHFADGLLALLVLFDLGTRLAFRPPATWLRSFTSTFALLLVAAVLVMAAARPTHRISSPNLDFATFLLVLVGTLYLVDCLEGGFSLPPALVSACVFATTAATRPLYWLWAGYSLVLFLVIAGRARSWRTAFSLCALPAVVAVGWLARQSVLSGYPLYPLTISGLPVNWRLPSSLLHGENRIDFAWAREPGVNPNIVLGSWHWLPGWLRVEERVNLDVVLPLALLLLGLAIAISQRFRPAAAGRGKVALSVAVPAVVTLGIWFATAPDPRFVWAPIWLLPMSLLAWVLPDRLSMPRLVELVAAVAVALFLAWLGHEHRPLFIEGVAAGAIVVTAVLFVVRGRPWVARVIPLAVLVLLVAEFGIASTALFGGIHLAAGDSSGPIGTPPDPKPTLVPVVTASGLKVAHPLDSDQCWHALLCFPKLLGPQLHLRGTSVSDGFSLAAIRHSALSGRRRSTTDGRLPAVRRIP
jgi:hypothetical protein